MAEKRRTKPAPAGYERHPIDANLIRKVAKAVPMTAAQAMYPNLRSEAQRPKANPKGQGRR